MFKDEVSRRTVLSLMASAAALCATHATAAESPGNGRVIRPARAVWDSFWFGGMIIQTGLERLGYKVEEPRTLDTAVLYQSLSEGDVDFTADIVMPLAKTAMDQVKDTVVLAGTVVQPGSVSGFLVDKATADKHGIKFVEDLQDPKIAALFSDDGKRARMVGPNPGWDEDGLIHDIVKRLGVEETVDIVQGEYSILIADTVSRYKAGKPVLLYAWFPNTATVELRPGKELVWLQVKPEHAKEDQTIKGMAGCTGDVDPCNTGWDATAYMIAVNGEFAKENPAAMKFFSLVKMTLADRVEQNTKMIIDGEKSDADLRRHAQEWIDRNKAEFEDWIKQSLTA